jgi:hypothetical protein
MIRTFAIVTGVLALSLTCATSVTAGDKYPQLSPIPVAGECMACQAKCEKCAPNRRFRTVYDCKVDCGSRGNPSVVSDCGVFQRC